ncbi:hypothetical protein J113_24270 [Mycobacterium tuberculosis CAS/NITR204]|uniref:acetolactate synthase n=1 Tax=Mycobacterium tuberculosis CAS/NITR204 TaxID=1310114 RepID=R4MLY1_MYCTX|nr:hypothetical protein J113_24270 [Mycobacterium tuberculosis CAS/NITR204]
MAVTPVTVGDHLVARMRAAGISVVCGLPTSRLDSLLVRLSRDAGFQIVLARHEGGAGYLQNVARASGKSAAVFVAGPGATNVISAVANASVNQVPMLILTGEVAVGEFGLHSQQDTSDDGLGLGATFRRFCRCSVSIESIANARSKIDSAFRALASIPRGPVHIALPRDLVDERLPAHQLGTAAAGLGGLRTLAPCGPDVADEVIGRLDRSRAPCSCWGMAAGWTASASRSSRFARRRDFLLRPHRTGGGSSRKPIRCLWVCSAYLVTAGPTSTSSTHRATC